MSIVINLTVPEFNHAVGTAVLRLTTSLCMGLNASRSVERNFLQRLTDEVAGACGEIAFGKMSGRWFCPGVNQFHRIPDCFEDIEIRSTDKEKGRMIIRNNDSDKRRFVFAVVRAPSVEFFGWLYGKDCKKKRYIDNPGGGRSSWFIPRQDLNDMNDLNPGFDL